MKSISPLKLKLQAQVRLLVAGAAAMTMLLGSLVVVQSQGGTSPQTLRGESRRVILVPNTTVDAGEVRFAADTDNDGMSDEVEEDIGTDPNDPADADTDNDSDDLTNGDEVAIETDPNDPDSDDDGRPDGEEVGLGFNPLDPTNTPPPNAALASLQVTPNPVNISLNSLLGQDPVQLHVIGVRTDNSTADLTGSPTLTYQSFDESVVIVDDLGNVVGINAGQTTVRVSSGNVFAEVTVSVTTLNAGTLAEINIPGFANNVDVAGNFAYVAAGLAGLVVVNVTDRSAPVIVATLNTPGNANDVRIVGSFAYVADGSSGLQIIDISTPASPVLTGSLNTPGEANDVAVRGTLAYVADGSAGLRIIDVSNPAAPTTLGFVDSPGTAWGVDVSGDWVVVAAEQYVLIVDAAIPGTPTVAGSVVMPFATVLDLEVRNRFAYVATFGQGLQLIDFSIPTNPRIIGGVSGLTLKDVALANRYAVGAELNFPNLAPIFDLGDPSDPTFRAALGFSPSGNFSGTGLAITDQHIYMTGTLGSGSTDNGSSGTTRLFIIAYQGPQTEVTDTAGVAPTVIINSPQSGQSKTEGDRLPIFITATDDVKVASVQLIVNGVVVIEDRVAPYDITYSIPHGVTSLVIEAKAFDVAGNVGTSPPVTINVLPDPPPTVSIITPAEGQVLFEQQDLYLEAEVNDNSNVVQLLFTVNGQNLENSSTTVPAGITSLTVVATATDDSGQTASATRTVSVIPDPPPAINIVAPAEGTQLTEGQVVEFVADATDNIFVNSVEFTVNGNPLDIDFQSPYKRLFTIPTGISSLALEVAAKDNLDQVTTASRTYVVVPDPGTTVTGLVVDTSAQPVPGATVTVAQLAGQTGADGRFSIPNASTVAGNILARVTANIGGQPAANASLPVPPVVAGITDVGVITLSISPTAPTAFAVADYDGDFIPDVFVGYPDRQSLIYSFNAGQFTPNPNRLLPFGAVSSGANLVSSAFQPELTFGSRQQIFAQLTGLPGSVVDVSFEDGEMQVPKILATGLGGESAYTAIGLDEEQATLRAGGLKSRQALALSASNPAVLAFLQNGLSGTSISVRFGNDSEEGFGDPVILPVESSVPLRSLALNDINHDGLLDLLVIRPVTGTDAKVVVYLRTSEATFGDPVESPVTVRTTVPAKGALDFAIAMLTPDSSGTDVAVLGDDRVRIYQGDGAGAFVFVQEILLPADRVATGVTAFDVTQDGRSDLVVTASDVSGPTSKFALVYFNTSSGTFQAPIIRTYTAPINSGDTRSAIGEWGGSSNRLDLIVVDGESVKIFLDVGPFQSGS